MIGDAMDREVQCLDCVLKPCFPGALGLSRPGKADSQGAGLESIFFKSSQVSLRCIPGWEPQSYKVHDGVRETNLEAASVVQVNHNESPDSMVGGWQGKQGLVALSGK